MNEHMDKAAHVRVLNEEALAAVVGEFGLKLREERGVRWRVCARHRGVIAGMPFRCTILCTEGCIAYFLADDGEVFLGHIAQWDGEVKPLWNMDNYGGACGGTGTEPKATSSGSPKSKSRTPKSTPEDISAALDLIRGVLGL